MVGDGPPGCAAYWAFWYSRSATAGTSGYAAVITGNSANRGSDSGDGSAAGPAVVVGAAVGAGAGAGVASGWLTGPSRWWTLTRVRLLGSCAGGGFFSSGLRLPSCINAARCDSRTLRLDFHFWLISAICSSSSCKAFSAPATVRPRL